MCSNFREKLTEIKRLNDEHQKIMGEISSGKKKYTELERRIKVLSEHISSKNNQLEALKKRCEESKLQLAELTANERRIAAIHDLEKNRYSKIYRTIEEHKEMFSRAMKQKLDPQHPTVSPESATSSVHLPSTSVARELELGEKERQRDDLENLLEKREQDIRIRKNHNAARIVRLRKLLQANEEKRALYKEQLTALKATTNRDH